jgi:hypothetical protein
MEMVPTTANKKNVVVMPNAASTKGKNRPTMKFVIHRRKTATPILSAHHGPASSGNLTAGPESGSEK